MKKHRKFLIDLQTSEQFYNDQESRKIIGELIAMIDEGFNKQPKADWIPYTTNGELPCNGQKVWISFTNEVCSYAKQAWWIYDHFEWDNAKRVKDCPTAWMPYIVPQPYKKEGAEDESN